MEAQPKKGFRAWSMQWAVGTSYFFGFAPSAKVLTLEMAQIYFKTLKTNTNFIRDLKASKNESLKHFKRVK